MPQTKILTGAFNGQVIPIIIQQQRTSLTTLEQQTFNPLSKREELKKMNPLTFYSKKKKKSSRLTKQINNQSPKMVFFQFAVFIGDQPSTQNKQQQ